MFVEPIELIKDTANPIDLMEFNRVSMADGSSRWVNAAENRILRISHQTTKSRVRRMVRVDDFQNLPEAISGLVKRQSASVYMVIDEPVGSVFSDADLTMLTAMISTFCSVPEMSSKLLSSQT